jgi:hypothetical protein
MCRFPCDKDVPKRAAAGTGGGEPPEPNPERAARIEPREFRARAWPITIAFATRTVKRNGKRVVDRLIETGYTFPSRNPGAMSGAVCSTEAVAGARSQNLPRAPKEQGEPSMKKLALVALAVFLSATGTHAATEAGSTELQIAGSVQRQVIEFDDEEYGSTTISGQLTLNKFLSDGFSLGGSLRVSSTAEDDWTDFSGQEVEGATSSLVFLLGRGDFYLAPGANVIPYIGGHGGVISYSWSPGGGAEEQESSTLTYGLQGGLKIFSSESVSWNAELDLSLYEQEEDEDQAAAQVETPTVTVTTLFVGMSYYFY